MTAPTTGRKLLDMGLRVDRLDSSGVQLMIGYLLGASANSTAVRTAMLRALDAAETDQRQRVER